MSDTTTFANLIWQIADLLRGPYRPPQYERVMLPMTVLRRFDCVLAHQGKVLAEHEKHKGSKLAGDALDSTLNKVAGQRFHNHSPLDFEKLKGDPDNINKHLVSYIKGFSANVRASSSTSSSKPRSRRCTRRTSSTSWSRSSPTSTCIRRTGAERADGAHLREPHPPLQRAGQRDRRRSLHAARSDPLMVTSCSSTTTSCSPTRHGAQAARPGVRHGRHAGRGAAICASTTRGEALRLRAGLQQARLRHGRLRHAHEGGDHNGGGDNVRFGDIFTDDQFPSETFDYFLSNPPFGVDWKKQQKEIQKEHDKRGFDGRFGAGLPRVNDGALLFLQHMWSKFET
jgi:type I restriction enzyme M protein